MQNKLHCRVGSSSQRVGELKYFSAKQVIRGGIQNE